MSLLYGAASELGLTPEQVAGFYRSHWPRPVALGDPSFYRWQFIDAPAASGRDNCIVAVDAASGAVAGVMGLNPRPFSMHGRSVIGAELTSWFVDERYRAQGAAAKILKEVQSRYDVLIGMGISAAALPLYLRSGFRFAKAIPRFIRVLDFAPIGKVSRHTPLAEKLARAWLRRDHVPHHATEGLASAGGAYRAAVERFNLFCRDAPHLSWRFSHHPSFNYKTFVVRSTTEPGSCLVVLRDELCVPGLRLTHVVELLGDDPGVRAGIAFVDQYCRDNGMHAADFFCTASAVNRHLVAAGWFSAVDDEFLQFPHLFHPMELRTPPTTSLIYSCRSAPDAICDLSSLYITKSDADLDRPVP